MPFRDRVRRRLELHMLGLDEAEGPQKRNEEDDKVNYEA